MSINTIYENESIEDLQYNHLQIIQKKNGFRFGTDAVLLCGFAHIKNYDKVVDLGTGTGILSILLSQKAENLQIHAFEIQEDMADMASRSVLLNQLQDMIQIHHGDYRFAANILGKASQTVVVCNPPYGKERSTVLPPNVNKLISKHETETSIEATIEAASQLLMYAGRFYICFPSVWLVEVFALLRKYSLEPKKLRFVQSYAQKKPYLMLIEAVKHGKPYIVIDAPLILHNEDGSMKPEVKQIYHIKK